MDSLSFNQGLVIYYLSGYCEKRKTLSLDIWGSQWDMSTSMEGLENNTIKMSILYQDGWGNQVLQGEYYSDQSKSPLLYGKVAASWSSAFASASETVGVYATLGVVDEDISVPDVDMIPKSTKPENSVPIPESDENPERKIWWWPFGKSESKLVVKQEPSTPWWPFGDHYPNS